MLTEKLVLVGDKKYKVSFPSVGESTEADIEFSKTYNSALKNGILPRVAMESQIRKDELWPSEREDRLNILNKDIQELIVKIKTETDKDTRDNLKEQFAEIRNELLYITTQKQSLYNNTAEAKAEEAKIANLIWKCVLNEDGSRVWDSKEKFNNERDAELVGRLVEAFVGFTSGLEERMEQLNDIFKDPIVDESEENKSAVEILVSEEPVTAQA